MHEEVNQRVVALSVRTGRLTANVLARLLRMYLMERRNRTPTYARGRQTLKQLMDQNAGATNIEIDNSNIKSFDRVARKYHIDYAVKKDRSVDPPRYFIFFKSRDQDTMTMAFKEFVARNEKMKDRVPFREVLKKYKDLSILKNLNRSHVRNKHREQSL